MASTNGTDEPQCEIIVNSELESCQKQLPIPQSPPRRRSARLTKTPSGVTTPASSAAKSPASMTELRRNRKRKASQPVNQQVPSIPDNLLDEALAPLTATDIEEWEGWIELESEPAFFNTILRDLGVQNVRAQEVFSIDQDYLNTLPKPVFGLIFCFQYLPEADEVEQDEDTSDVWFANQTTSNACATVALLNIIMNASEIELGGNLREFKESTKDLPTALRGHQLSQNIFIRKIHNSFTRRMDHLNADLVLENDASDALAAKAVKKRAPPKKGKKAQGRSKKSTTEYGFHFLAYVPVGGFVWELDGLNNRPRKLDPISEGNWTSAAQPQIEARMMQDEDNQFAFNLLALCQNPLAAQSQAIAGAMASLLYLHAHMPASTNFTQLLSTEENLLDMEDEEKLSVYKLKKTDIENAHIPDALKERISREDFDEGMAFLLYRKLEIEVKSALGEYRAELASIADDERRVKGRKKDYGLALHKWVKKLAEKGVLEELIKNSS
ncbi:Fc.00g013740.m01.CDS01 [Cosmosporella sp. VM-42]